MSLSWPFIFAFGLLAEFVFLIAISVEQRFYAHRRWPDPDRHEVGQRATTVTQVGPDGGTVLLDGVYWSATAEEAIAAGTVVTISGANGVRLRVVAAATSNSTRGAQNA